MLLTEVWGASLRFSCRAVRISDSVSCIQTKIIFLDVGGIISMLAGLIRSLNK